jgi:thioredoxin-related protein
VEKIMSNKIKYIFTMFLILFISFFSCKENSNDKVSAKDGSSSVRWENTTTGLESAKIQKKPVLMFFYTEWCIYCKKMDSEIFSDPEISRYMNENFISMRLNPEKDKETIEIMGEKITPSKLMAYTGSNGFPTTLFLNNKKKPVTTLPGFIEKQTFLSILKYLKEECYESKVSLDDYIKNPEVCRSKKG